MASHFDEDALFLPSDDDLVEIQYSPSPHRNANSRSGLILPRPESSSSRTSHSHRHSTRRSHHHHAAQTTQAPQEPAAVIDLTEEPDSPVRSRHRSQSQNQGTRNPRRTNSQRISPPRLERSDSTFMGRPASFIDLTADSPPPYREPPYDHLRPPIPLPPSIPRRRAGGDDLIELQFMGSNQRARGMPAFAIGLGRRLAGFLGADIIGLHQAIPLPHLDVSLNAFAPRESPKPPMEPAPPTREGFTRDTCAEPEEGSETVIICPACSEELAYDPSDPVSPSPSGGKKRKRAAGEHHFWALKKCGHVRRLCLWIHLLLY